VAGSLRVIAGTARGRVLRLPTGAATRPTSGRLREALFSILEAANVDFERVLDLYAGSGALGIEALSRGAGSCTFVEADPRAIAAVRDNVARAGFEADSNLVRARVGQWRPSRDATFTLVLADPPYDDAAAWDAIERSVQGNLATGATLVVEHPARRGPPSRVAGLALWRDRRQGEGAVAIYRDAAQRDAGEDR
jgi:16S rRNA (guanine966-N2)-methyltransferase